MFVINGRNFVARYLERGLHRAVYKFDSGKGVVVKLQKAERNQNRNELEALKTVARIACKHVPLFNQEMCTVSFDGKSLCGFCLWNMCPSLAFNSYERFCESLLLMTIV